MMIWKNQSENKQKIVIVKHVFQQRLPSDGSGRGSAIEMKYEFFLHKDFYVDYKSCKISNNINIRIL
jgi:hypothetical protein